MNRTMRAESGAEVAKEDVWDQVSALVGRFGHAAEQYAARFDFGISPEVIRGRMEPILGDARRIRLAGWGALPGGPVLRECLARLRDLAPKTYQKTVARIAGVFVIHSYFRSRMTQEAIGQAISTSSFYELTQDLLDDLLDGGGWTVREADRLYDRCLRPMTDSAVSTNGLEDELANFMGPGQDGLEHVLASATRALRGLLASSDERIRGLVREGHDALARAQAATVHFRHEGLDIPAVTNIAASLPSPILPCLGSTGSQSVRHGPQASPCSTRDLHRPRCRSENWPPMPAPGSPSTRLSRSSNTSREPRPTFARECSTSHASTQTSRPRSLKGTRSEDSRLGNVNRSSRKRPGASSALCAKESRVVDLPRNTCSWP